VGVWIFAGRVNLPGESQPLAGDSVSRRRHFTDHLVDRSVTLDDEAALPGTSRLELQIEDPAFP